MLQIYYKNNKAFKPLKCGLSALLQKKLKYFEQFRK